MSFSRKVKEELGAQVSRARHCQIAELSGLFQICGSVVGTLPGDTKDGAGKNFSLEFVTENLTVAQKCSILVSKAFHIEVKVQEKVHSFLIQITDPEETRMIFQALKLTEDRVLVHELVIQRSCCKRAFLRGLFLACGSVTDPSRGYHLEMALGKKEKAMEVVKLLRSFEIEARIAARKKNYIVYLKEGALIVEMLNVMEAHVALMAFENVRILKEMRNSINRQVNCETANIKKTVSAAARQIEDIRYIKDTSGFGTLPKGLADIARLRLEHAEVSLKELGQMLDPPIGKSGVNHRLRKLSEIAEDLRKNKPSGSDGSMEDKND